MTSTKTSRIPNFFKASLERRREVVAERAKDGDISPLLSGGLDDALLDRLVENAVGQIGLPIGMATNFTINGLDVLVPMAVEEPSVIAAASNAARMARNHGGFTASGPDPFTIAQIEILGSRVDPKVVEERAEEILRLADSSQKELVELGGGARELIVRRDVGSADRVVVHLVVDCLDAMGANIVNTMAETVAPVIAGMTQGAAGLKILTNLADRRVASCECSIPAEGLERKGFEGTTVAEGVVRAFEFAQADPYRAATHNKGIFNGVDAVLLATGNDWRAVEAGAHAHAARGGSYGPLSTWTLSEGVLKGRLEMPMAVGVVGGASRAHPCAAKCLEIMGADTAGKLAKIAASVGLASNLAALAALATEGIQAGHMRLHKKRL